MKKLMMMTLVMMMMASTAMAEQAKVYEVKHDVMTVETHDGNLWDIEIDGTELVEGDIIEVEFDGDAIVNIEEA